jgi:hypothetical protein
MHVVLVSSFASQDKITVKQTDGIKLRQVSRSNTDVIYSNNIYRIFQFYGKTLGKLITNVVKE